MRERAPDLCQRCVLRRMLQGQHRTGALRHVYLENTASSTPFARFPGHKSFSIFRCDCSAVGHWPSLSAPANGNEEAAAGVRGDGSTEVHQ